MDGELDDPRRQVVDEAHATEASAADRVVGLAPDSIDDPLRQRTDRADRIIPERGTCLAATLGHVVVQRWRRELQPARVVLDRRVDRDLELRGVEVLLDGDQGAACVAD